MTSYLGQVGADTEQAGGGAEPGARGEVRDGHTGQPATTEGKHCHRVKREGFGLFYDNLSF